jgi:uncharacterized protein (TIGR00270 family)
METCEICGVGIDQTTYLVIVEGAEMATCRKCAQGNKVKNVQSTTEHTGRHLVADYRRNSEEVCENYGRVIKSARELMGIPISVLAERINEKESTLKRVEEEKMLPTAKLTAKLEGELGIKLASKTESEQTTAYKTYAPGGQATIEDVAIRRGGSAT